MYLVSKTNKISRNIILWYNFDLLVKVAILKNKTQPKTIKFKNIDLGPLHVTKL